MRTSVAVRFKVGTPPLPEETLTIHKGTFGSCADVRYDDLPVARKLTKMLKSMPCTNIESTIASPLGELHIVGVIAHNKRPS